MRPPRSGGAASGSLPGSASVPRTTGCTRFLPNRCAAWSRARAPRRPRGRGRARRTEFPCGRNRSRTRTRCSPGKPGFRKARLPCPRPPLFAPWHVGPSQTTRWRYQERAGRGRYENSSLGRVVWGGGMRETSVDRARSKRLYSASGRDQLACMLGSPAGSTSRCSTSRTARLRRSSA